MPAGTIVILGRVELLCDDKPADLRRQSRMALALMVAARGRPVRRQEISAAIWGNEDTDLRTLMWSLRRALRDCNSGFDVPPDKSKAGNYRLVVAEPGNLEDAVDAFRFLSLVGEGEALRAGGDEQAATGRLTAAASLWGGDPFADLWPDGPPEACRRLRAELERARDFLARTLAETALRRGTPYAAARAVLGGPAGDRVADDAPGHEAAWLAAFLIALYDGPGTDEAERLLARRRQAHRPGDDIVARADDLILLAEAGIDVHRALTVDRRPPVAGSPAELVGREAELTAFGHLLDTVLAGRPASLVATGASGRGKTRLAAEFAYLAGNADVPVVLVNAAQPGDLRPWQEFAERLWPAACRDVGSPGDRLTLGQRRALLDFIAPRQGEPTPPEPDQAQPARFAEITRALAVLARRVAARRGLVVAFDNAEQFTERGRELLALFLASLHGGPVGMVLLGSADGTWADIASGTGQPARLRLRPLSAQAIGSWLRQVRARAPADDEIDAIARATDGEPVRIRDHVAAMAVAAAGTAPAGQGAGGAPRVPSAWLAAAAITAADLVIDTGLVARMLDLSDEQADREELRARRLGWIDTSAGVRFTHGSHRDDVLARLDSDPALRRALHRRAFETLTARQRGDEGPDPSLPVRIAGHALRADRDLPADEAARAFLAAARAERTSGEAAETWARAGIAKGPADPAVRACLHLALGDALDQRGGVTDADREYQLAYDIAEARPVERAEALIRLGRRWTDPGKIDWYLLDGLQGGIAALAGDDDPVAVALRLQLTAHLARKSTLAIPVLGTEADSIRRDGIAMARAALAQVNRLPPAAACEVLHECRWALYDYDPPAETLRLSERLERESILARSPYFQSEALITLAIDQLRLGQVTDAQGTLLAYERSRPDSHASRWLQLTMETLLDLWHGRFAAAETRLLSVAAPLVTRAHAERAGPADTLQQTWQGQAYWLRREQGLVLRETDPEAWRQVEGHAFFAIWRVALALDSCDAGDLDTAAAHVRALDEAYDRFAAFPSHGWTVSVAALLAETCLAMSPAGRRVRDDPLGGLLPDIVRRLRAILDRHAGEFVLAGWPSVLLGPVERCAGLLAMAEGEFGEALDLFDGVCGRVADAPPQAARLQVDRARALIRRGSGAGDAAGLLRQARDTARRLGMRTLAADAAELLAES